MTDQLTGRSLLAVYIDQHEDNYKAAGALLDDLKVTGRARDALFAIVVEAVLIQRRHQTRRVERRAFTRRPELGAHDQVLARKELAAESFALGDGRRVRWLEATVDDHQERIEMLRKKADGLRHSIRFHEVAIAQIQKAGVRCLAELKEWAA